jgi:hypothetical protein
MAKIRYRRRGQTHDRSWSGSGKVTLTSRELEDEDGGVLRW